MDTVHHDVPGSRRAETNEWGNMINATAYMIPPIIEKMGTASLDIKHGNRVVIYTTTHLTPPAVVRRALITTRNAMAMSRSENVVSNTFTNGIQIQPAD
jgi:hypothetical protein